MSEFRDEVAGVLAEHHLGGDTSRQYDVAGQCTCGKKFYEIGGAPDSYLAAHRRLLVAHAAHQADALMPLLERREREARAVERERVADAIDAEKWQFRRVTGATAGDVICRAYEDAERIARTSADATTEETR